jgi:hypothetical protein
MNETGLIICVYIFQTLNRVKYMYVSMHEQNDYVCMNVLNFNRVE